MSDDLIELLYASDAANSLTNEAARALESAGKENERLRKELMWIAERGSDRTVPVIYRVDDMTEAARSALEPKP